MNPFLAICQASNSCIMTMLAIFIYKEIYPSHYLKKKL